jgi:endonuclease G
MAKAKRPAAKPPARISAWTLLRFALRCGGLLPLWVWALAALALAAWEAYEIKIARPAQSWMGLPQAENWKNPYTWIRVLRNDGFMLGYSDLRGNPLWVVYALAPPSPDAPKLKRPSRFSVDRRGINRVDHEDYTASGYDRGHMAPNHAISALYGRAGQTDTFLMTNVTPQRPNLNEKLWERLEEIELDRFARQFGKVWVTTGPIFEPPSERLRSSWRVEIPDAFYKILIAPEAKKMLAFAMPQNVRGDEPLDHYLTSVDAIEKRTGLDFFPELDDALENRLEAEVDPESWHLRELARLPGRYGHKPENGDEDAASASKSKKP